MKNSEILGIHYIVFQYQFNNFVKCFLDGKENYDYYSLNDFIRLTDNLNDKNVILAQLKEALSESSLFLWDVDNSHIRRLNADSYEKENVFISNPLVLDDNNENIFDPKNDVGFKKGDITLKKFKLF